MISARTALASLSIGYLLTSGIAGEKPNVLLIVADDLRPEPGCYGGLGETPQLDALAESGMRFDRAYCQKAVCWPSRNSFFSGLMPANLGKANHERTFRASHPEIDSLPQWFKKHGWYTASFGKILHNGQDDPESWSQPHFDSPPLHYARPENADKHPIINRHAPENKANPLFESADVADDAYEDGLIAEAAVSELERRAESDDPFFLMVGFHKPHSPFNAPKKYWDLYDREAVPLSLSPKPPLHAPLKFVFHESNYLRSFADFPDSGPIPETTSREAIHAYLACVSYVDALTGQLLAALEATGKTDETIVIFTSDHGYQLGDHGLWSKHTTFELATRIPLIFSGPGVDQNAETDALVELVDLFPTLCDLADLDKPPHLEGRSFSNVLVDPEADVRESAYSEFSRGGATGRSIRTNNRRYTEWRDTTSDELRARELYLHDRDPIESENVAARADLKDEIENLAKMLRARADQPDRRSDRDK